MFASANNSVNFGGGVGMFSAASATGTHNPMKDFEVVSPPDDSISSLAFSPASLPQNFLIAGSWDNQIRCWEVQSTGQTIPKAQQTHQGPVLDVAWSDDGTKVFSASCDKTVKMWDLNSNQALPIAQHDAPVKTVHWLKAPNYTCIMTGSWDKTLKFWDTRTPTPMLTITLPERCYCADVHRCVSIFLDKKSQPSGFGLGSVEGRVAIQYVNPQNPKDNFTFKCHRANGTTNGFQEIFAVNDIAFHPVHGTLATVGSDGKFSFWDKDARTKLKTSEQMEQPVTRCCFNARGEIFAYSVSYDWSKPPILLIETHRKRKVHKDAVQRRGVTWGHEFYNAQKKNYIFLHSCFEELKPRTKK
ncbi:hypothetical protein HPB47_005286 [Ixodes persulcatus]|uniref:Uncharacterized protein n=1 Tax=Ixodes persulcatus TaxID=34615 RepID=A0AC60PDU8_IXOPE|nr:hypothetical protein HPB47_005286 [Ixodes persulcatus]